MIVKVTESWTCPTCSNPVSTLYCPACGESPPNKRDLTLHGLFAQILHAFTDIDGRLLRSFRCLLTHPGLLTVAYVQGRRKPYLGPFQLFLIANVLFFATQSLTNTNIVSSTLDSHLHTQDWRAIAQRLVAHRLEAKQMTLDQYAPIFNRAIVLHAKSFIILMVPPFAVLLLIMFYQSSQPFVAHVVFALYFFTFLQLLFCVLLIVAAVDVLLGGAGLISPRMDNILSLINLAACAIYLYIATGIVYGSRGWIRGVKVVGLATAIFGILLGYRFVLFLGTLYST